ncbi:MAG: dephospho-CoA kinase [Rhodocyclaceae bacterium]|nr:MAG: dephospho-CoA kinase [Rhodocyclaceae bacterium]
MKPGLVVGLTGGIGSGKSAAASAFASLGAAIVDTDAIAHELTGPEGGAMADIAAAFGPTVVRPDGSLDRAAMRQRVFADPAERARLEAILHPLIRRLSDERVHAALDAGAPYVILAVPLLVESAGYRQRVHRVAVVDCSEDTQVRRVMARSAMSESQVRAIMAAQADRAQRLAAADEVIDNSGDLDGLAEKVRALDGRYRQIAAIARANPSCSG